MDDTSLMFVHFKRVVVVPLLVHGHENIDLEKPVLFELSAAFGLCWASVVLVWHTLVAVAQNATQSVVQFWYLREVYKMLPHGLS